MGTRNIEPGLIEGFVTRVRRWRQLMREFIFDSPSLASGELWCYGASTKGQTLLGYLDANERFTAVADRNPAKHGMLMNGSWLRIESEDTMRKAKPTAVLVLPWAFKREFVARAEALRDHGIATGLLTLEMFQNAGASPGDSEGLIDHLRSIAGVEAVGLIREREDGTQKVSLRSRGEVDVEKIARHHGGGGHRNAAVFVLQGDGEALREQVAAALGAALSSAPAAEDLEDA